MEKSLRLFFICCVLGVLLWGCVAGPGVNPPEVAAPTSSDKVAGDAGGPATAINGGSAGNNTIPNESSAGSGGAGAIATGGTGGPDYSGMDAGAPDGAGVSDGTTSTNDSTVPVDDAGTEEDTTEISP
jgi:hypothetical protein